MKNFLISVFIFSLSHPAFAGSDLHSAAVRGDLDAIHEILESGVSVNVLADEDLTPLHSAARNGQDEAVRLLLEKGTGINLLDDFGWTPLHWAVANGHLETAELLTNSDVGGKNHSLYSIRKAMDQGDVDGRTPLHYAVRNQHKEIVELLLDRGANIDAIDDMGQTPLIITLWSQNLPVVVEEKLITRKYVNFNKRIAEDSNFAKQFENQREKSFEIAKLLLDRGADPNVGGYHSWLKKIYITHTLFSPFPPEWFCTPSKERQIDCMRIYSFPALHVAAWNGQAEAVELLLDRGANSDLAPGGIMTALAMALKYEHYSVAAIFERRGLTQ